MAVFEVSEAWSQAYPHSHAGVLLVRAASDPAPQVALEERRLALESQLRERYAGQDRLALLQHPILQAYDRYYRGFKKTYHVQLQLESVVFKGKSIPSVAPLVEAMFMAEMDQLLLTAGHDYDRLELPLTLDVARGDETYTLLRGEPQTAKPGDMFIRDGAGIVSSIIYGPDQRTQITTATRSAIFTIYAPDGIAPESVQQQLDEIRDNVLLIAPLAQVEISNVYGVG